MKTKSEAKEKLKYLNEINKLWNKIDKLKAENKMIKNNQMKTLEQLQEFSNELHKFGNDKVINLDISKLNGYAEHQSALKSLINLKTFCEKQINIISNSKKQTK